MDTESAWRERLCKVNFTFQVVDHLQAESFTEDIFEGYDNTKAFRWKAVLNEFRPKGRLDFADLWRGDTVPGRSWSKVTDEQLESSVSDAAQPLYGLALQRRRHECCDRATAALIRAA